MRIEKIKNIISIDKGLELIGSNSNDQIIYKTDYDFQEIKMVASIKERAKIVKKFQKMFEQIARLKDVYITDFKAGVYESQVVRWSKEQVLLGYQDIETHRVFLADCLMNKDQNIIKLDVIAYIEGKYAEISCNYYFTESEKPKDQLFLSLLLDIKKYYHANKLMKMYKRIYSYRMLHKQDVSELITLFNSEIGFLNMLLHDIDVLVFMEDEGIRADANNVERMKKRIYSQLPNQFKKLTDLRILRENLMNLINKLLEEN